MPSWLLFINLFTMSARLMSVHVPTRSGFNPAAGGGGKDPRKPGPGRPERAHYATDADYKLARNTNKRLQKRRARGRSRAASDLEETLDPASLPPTRPASPEAEEEGTLKRTVKRIDSRLRLAVSFEALLKRGEHSYS